MRTSTVITALLLFSYNWISVSGSETLDTVEVHSGEDVTLLCPNISGTPTQTEWFTLVNGTKPRCISSMYKSDNQTTYCDGFKHGFEMSSNMSTVFLKIQQVDLSNSALYFCGFYIGKHTVISSAVHLNVQGNSESVKQDEFKPEKEPDGMTNLMTVILGALTVLLTIVIIVLAVKIRKLHKAVTEQQQERNKNLGSDDLNYAALSFHSKPKRKHKPTSKREPEPNVVYAATR
ncbi:hypothetical protein Q5P01_002238 [Channa striata]|uniref:Immunoglobulin domain-containing protein n=1 Tax=Channa striata TaxID=64152 RepID=A0AA88NNU2_CHASR|nr:hypothetical protein Q5P01_002238 [Channa striata]